MKRWLILIALLMSSVAWAGSTTVVVGQVSSGSGGGGASFCSGSELFCEDFEGDDTAWDAYGGDSTAETEDCDGYDADGDWCTDETSTPPTGGGTEILGVRGGANDYLQESLTSSAGELYLECWWKTSDVTTAYGINLYNTTSSKSVVNLFIDASSRLTVRVNANTVTFTNTGAATAHTMVENEWTHIGVYYKEEVGGGNDGVCKMWVNTDGGTFDSGDLIVDESGVNTNDYNAEVIRLSGPSSVAGYFDNVKVSGTSPW